MKVLISPAKSLNFDPIDLTLPTTLPYYQKEARTLINKLKSFSRKKLKELMSISDELAILNQNRYRNFSDDYAESKAALLAFSGDVYVGMEADQFTNEELAYANEHIRILSGLYGILRPLDKIQPYRLEMGTRLKVRTKNNLVQFWRDKLTKHLNNEMAESGESTVLNLASNEYFDALDLKKLTPKVIDVDFKEERNGALKFISFNAKKARGMMCNYIVKNKIDTVEDVKGFDYEDYHFETKLSSENKLVFIR